MDLKDKLKQTAKEMMKSGICNDGPGRYVNWCDYLSDPDCPRTCYYAISTKNKKLRDLKG